MKLEPLTQKRRSHQKTMTRICVAVKLVVAADLTAAAVAEVVTASPVAVLVVAVDVAVAAVVAVDVVGAAASSFQWKRRCHYYRPWSD